MSDARAKAEARRAKILARESSMKVQAIGDDLVLPVDGTPQERPLAKRRSLVKAVSERAAADQQQGDEDSTTPQKGKDAAAADSVESEQVTPAKEVVSTPSQPSAVKESAPEAEATLSVDDPEVESIAQLEEKHNEDSPSPSPAPKSTAEESESKKEMLKKLSPKKSLKEIEEEVAKATAKYDADTLKGEESKGMKRSKVSKETAMKAKAAGAVTSNINPTNVTRLIRMFVIICLGVYKGYTVVQSNISARDSTMIRAMEAGTTFGQVQQTMGVDEFGDPIVLNAAEALSYQQQQQQQQETAKPTRTWAQWAQYKVTAPFESTLTAVGVSYWLANMLSAGINSRLKSAPKPKGILEQLMSLYQSGFEGVLERVFCLLGEYALHLGTILVVVTLLTLVTEVPTANLSAASVVDVVTDAARQAAEASAVQTEL